MHEVDFARRTRGKVVGKDGDGASQHDDSPAFVIGGDEDPAPHRLFEADQEFREACRCLEVAPVQHDARCLCLAKQPHVIVGQVRPGQPEHEPASHHSVETHPALPVIRRGERPAARG